jgi:hypothetical protein
MIEIGTLNTTVPSRRLASAVSRKHHARSLRPLFFKRRLEAVSGLQPG